MPAPATQERGWLLMAHRETLRRELKACAVDGFQEHGISVSGVDVTLHRTGAATVRVRLGPDALRGVEETTGGEA